MEVILKGGHIAVFYRFSKLRDTKTVMLTDNEKMLMNRLRWKEKKMKNQYDGEIRFEYPERFYYLKTIIIKKQTNNTSRQVNRR